MLLLHEFLYATMDITSVSAPRYMTYVVLLHFAAVQHRLIDTNKTDTEIGSIDILCRYRPSLPIDGVLGKMVNVHTTLSGNYVAGTTH